MDRETARRYLAHYNAGELNEKEKRELKAFLREHPSFKQEAKQYTQIWKQLEEVEEDARQRYEKSPIAEDDALDQHDELRSTLQDVSKPSKPHSRGSSTRRSKPKLRRSRRPKRSSGTPWKALGAAAAVLVAFLVGFTVMNAPDQDEPNTPSTPEKEKAIATLEQTSPGLQLLRDGEPVQVSAGSSIRQNDLLTVPGGETAQFRYNDENTSIQLGKNETEVQLRNTESTKRIDLRSGMLEANVEEQQAGQKLVTTTPLGRAEIIGTKFSLTYNERVRLEVTDGTVKLISNATGKSIRVQKKEYGEISPEGVLSHGRLGEREKPEEPKSKPPVAESREDSSVINKDQETMLTKGLVKGLVGHWTFDKGSGSVVPDRSNTRNDGKLEGSPNWTQEGKIGGAMDFPGGAHYVRIPHVDAYLLDQGTLSFWFRAEAFLSRHQGLITKDAGQKGTGGHFGVAITTEGELSFYLQGVEEDNNVTEEGISENTWHHVTCTWGSDGMKLYLDGKKIGENDYIGGLGPSSGGKGNFEPFVIGVANWTSDERSATPIKSVFDGRIDDVRLYNRVLQPAEVDQLAEEE